VTRNASLAVLGGAILAALVGADLYYVRTPAVTAQTADTPCYINNGVGSIAAVASGNCRNHSGRLLGFRMVSTSGTLAFLRLYNLATPPVCSSAVGFQESIPIPANMTGSGIVDTASNFFYNQGLGYCLTGGGGNNDNTAPPAGVFGVIRTGN
jgi:hypothetical protein